MRLTLCCLSVLTALASATTLHASAQTAVEMVKTNQRAFGVVVEEIMTQLIEYPAVAECLRAAGVEFSLLAKIDELLASESLWDRKVARRDVKDGSAVPKRLLQSLFVAQSLDNIIGDLNALLNTPTCSGLVKLDELRFIAEILVIRSHELMFGLSEEDDAPAIPSGAGAFLYQSVRLHVSTVLFAVSARLNDHKKKKGRARSLTRIIETVRDVDLKLRNMEGVSPKGELDHIESLGMKTAAVSEAIRSALESFNPSEDELEALNHLTGLHFIWDAQVTELRVMADNLRAEISKTTTTTVPPVTLSYDELAALFESPDKPKKKQSKKKKGPASRPVVGLKSGTISSTSTTVSPTTLTTTLDQSIDDYAWTVVGRQQARKPRALTSTTTETWLNDLEHLPDPVTTTTMDGTAITTTAAGSTIKTPATMTATTKTTTAATTTATTATKTMTTTTAASVTTTITTTTTTAATTTATTTARTMKTQAPATVTATTITTTESSESTVTTGSTATNTPSFIHRNARRSDVNHPRGFRRGIPEESSSQQPYVVMPLAKLTVDQMWTLTTQMIQLSEQLGQLSLHAFQQPNDPAIVANIEFFYHKAAYAHQVLADLQMTAGGLVEFVNSMPVGFLVSAQGPV